MTHAQRRTAPALLIVALVGALWSAGQSRTLSDPCLGCYLPAIELPVVWREPCPNC